VPHAHLKLQSAEALRLLHHHPGYLRAQANPFVGLSDADPVITAARNAAEAAPGYRRWSYNSKTGTILVEYEPGDLDVDDLLARIAKKAGLSGVVFDIHSNAHRKQLISGFFDAVQEVNGIVARGTDYRADLRELIPAALAVTSFVSFILGGRAGPRFPSWDSAPYRGYRIFMQWHKREVAEREKRERKLDEKAEKAGHVLDEVI